MCLLKKGFPYKLTSKGVVVFDCSLKPKPYSKLFLACLQQDSFRKFHEIFPLSKKDFKKEMTILERNVIKASII